MSSSVKTDWNCSLSTLAIAQSDVAGKPEPVLREGTPVSSLQMAIMYDQKDIGLSFRLAAANSDMHVRCRCQIFRFTFDLAS